MGKLRRRLSRRSDYGDDLLSNKLLSQLRQESIDDSIISEELKAATQETLIPAVKSVWQRHLIHFLHSTPLEVLVVVLVILDVIILLTMLVLELHILELKLRDENESTELAAAFLHRHCMGSSGFGNHSGHNLMVTLKAVEELGCHVNLSFTYDDDDMPQAGSNSSMAEPRHKRSAAAVDDDLHHSSATIHDLEVAEHVLHFCSIFILGLMVVEVFLKVAGLGKSYFRGKLEIVDGIVIFISFAMDLYFYRGIFADGFSNMATVLVIFLLWRIARIFNAILVTAKTRLEFRIRVQKRARSQLVDKVNALQIEKDMLKEHINNLRVLCRGYKIPEDIVQRAEPLVVPTRRHSTAKALSGVLKMSVNLASGLGLAPGKAAPRRPMNGTTSEQKSLLKPEGHANGTPATASMLQPPSSNGTTSLPGNGGQVVVSMAPDCTAAELPTTFTADLSAVTDNSDKAFDVVLLLSLDEHTDVEQQQHQQQGRSGAAEQASTAALTNSTCAVLMTQAGSLSGPSLGDRSSGGSSHGESTLLPLDPAAPCDVGDVATCAAAVGISEGLDFTRTVPTDVAYGEPAVMQIDGAQGGATPAWSSGVPADGDIAAAAEAGIVTTAGSLATPAVAGPATVLLEAAELTVVVTEH